VTPFSEISFREFVDKYFAPNSFPTLKLSTQQRYRRTLGKHLLPAFGDSRICYIGTLQLQQFVLHKMPAGLGWQCADHYRDLMSKIFVTAKKWGFFAGDNPAIGFDLPENKSVREKHVLLPNQIPLLRGVSPDGSLENVHHLEIYTISIPQAQREAVENLAHLVTNGDESGPGGKTLALASERIQ
jgi:hypothetical protein